MTFKLSNTQRAITSQLESNQKKKAFCHQKNPQNCDVTGKNSCFKVHQSSGYYGESLRLDKNNKIEMLLPA